MVHTIFYLKGRKTMKKLLTAMLVLLLATACSSGSETPADESNVLRVGMECDYAPFNWTTLTTNEFTKQISSVDYADGYDVVIASMIAEDLGMDVQIVKLDWDALIPSLQNGEIDLIVAGMTDTPERRQSISFTTPYYESQMAIIIQKGSELENVTDIQELSGYKVMGQLSTLYDEIIDQIDGVVHLDPKASYPEMIPDITNGIADALTAELPVAIGVCAANPSLTYVTFEDGHGFDVDTSVSIGLRKEDTDLLNKVQASLDKISEDTRVQLMLDATDRQPATEE